MALATEGPSGLGSMVFATGLTGTDTITPILLGTGWPIGMPADIIMLTVMDIATDTPTGLSMLPGLRITVMPMHPTGSITYGMDKDTPAGLSIYLGRSITVTPMHHALHINCTMDMLTTLRTGMFPIMRRAIMPVCGPPCLIDIRHIPRILPPRPTGGYTLPTRQSITVLAMLNPGPNTLL